MVHTDHHVHLIKNENNNNKILKFTLFDSSVRQKQCSPAHGIDYLARNKHPLEMMIAWTSMGKFKICRRAVSWTTYFNFLGFGTKVYGIISYQIIYQWNQIINFELFALV